MREGEIREDRERGWGEIERDRQSPTNRQTDRDRNKEGVSESDKEMVKKNFVCVRGKKGEG